MLESRKGIVSFDVRLGFVEGNTDRYHVLESCLQLGIEARKIKLVIRTPKVKTRSHTQLLQKISSACLFFRDQKTDGPVCIVKLLSS